MPTVLIEVRRHYTPAEEIAIIDAVHGAMVTAFQIPAADKNVRLVAHEPHRFAVPAHLAQPLPPAPALEQTQPAPQAPPLPWRVPPEPEPG